MLYNIAYDLSHWYNEAILGVVIFVLVVIFLLFGVSNNERKNEN